MKNTTCTQRKRVYQEISKYKITLKNYIHTKKSATDQTAHFSTREVKQLDQMKGGNEQTHMCSCALTRTQMLSLSHTYTPLSPNHSVLHRPTAQLKRIAHL